MSVEALGEAYKKMLECRIDEMRYQSFVLLAKYCSNMISNGRGDALQIDHVAWFAQFHVTEQMVLENNMAPYDKCEENAVALESILKLLSQRMEERTTMKLPAKVHEALHAMSDQLIDHLSERAIFRHQHDHDLTYGGRIPAPLGLTAQHE